LNFYRDNSLKQQSAGRHVGPLGYINLILSQIVFALIPLCCVLSRETANTNFIVFGLIWQELEPLTTAIMLTTYHSLWFDLTEALTTAIMLTTYVVFLKIVCWIIDILIFMLYMPSSIIRGKFLKGITQEYNWSGWITLFYNYLHCLLFSTLVSWFLAESHWFVTNCFIYDTLWQSSAAETEVMSYS